MSSLGRQRYKGDPDEYLYLTGDEPLVRQILKLTFPRYTRSTFRLNVTDGAINVRPKKDTRSDFMFYDLDTKEVRRVVRIDDDNSTQRRRTTLPPRVICVEHRYTDRREYGIVIHVSRDDAGPLLPPVQPLTIDEQIVLRYSSRYMASYGGNIKWRQTRAAEDTGITDERWNTARDSLISKGLLNDRYGLTDQGANHARLPAAEAKCMP